MLNTEQGTNIKCYSGQISVKSDAQGNSHFIVIYTLA